MNQLCLSSSFPSTLLPNLPPPQFRRGASRTALNGRRPGGKCCAARGSFGGDAVDEDMIVLRKRMRKIEMMEKGDDDPCTAEWMEWEKSYKEAYNSDVCEAMGLLQALLLRTRPSLTFGMAGILLLSVPTSTIVVSSHLVELVKMAILHLT